MDTASKANSRALVTDSKGGMNTFLGCDSYRLVPSCFGLVVRVEGFNNVTGWEIVGVFYRPTAASIGMAEPEQIEYVIKRKTEAAKV
jgi:hypothetical protein